jgi:hypothetical protein
LASIYGRREYKSQPIYTVKCKIKSSDISDISVMEFLVFSDISDISKNTIFGDISDMPAGKDEKKEHVGIIENHKFISWL